MWLDWHALFDAIHRPEVDQPWLERLAGLLLPVIDRGQGALGVASQIPERGPSTTL